MRRSERQGAWATWAAMGLGVGILAGFALAEAVGAVDRERVRRTVRRLGAEPAPAPLSAAATARRAALALAQEPELAGLELETLALGAGRVELAGWVPDRRRRALAERRVAAIPGITSVVNRLLVDEEDPDDPIEEGVSYLNLEGQSA